MRVVYLDSIEILDTGTPAGNEKKPMSFNTMSEKSLLDHYDRLSAIKEKKKTPVQFNLAKISNYLSPVIRRIPLYPLLIHFPLLS